MLNKLRYKIALFMRGRYGADNLYKFLLAVYLILFVLQLIFEKTYLTVIMTVVVVFMIFRLLSKNHIARARENRLYLKLSAPIRRFFSINYKRIKDIRTKRYKVCKHCKAIVRLPIKKGTHTVNCPKCKKDFKVKIRF